MKVKIASKTLKEVIKRACVPGGARALPVLQHIKVEAGEYGIIWQSTDLECAATYTAGTVEMAGACLVPLAALKNAAKSGGDVEIIYGPSTDATSATGAELRIIAGGQTVKLFPPSVEDYPLKSLWRYLKAYRKVSAVLL